MAVSRSLIAPTSNPLLERALLEKLTRRAEAAGSLGKLEPLALRLGLMQDTLKPRLRDPQLLVFAADHGIAVDGIDSAARRSTAEQVQRLLAGQLPLAVFARIQQIALTVVDCGVADNLAAHDGLLMRKIAHGTRNARVGPAMALEQAHASIRAGMEIGDAMRGNLVACAGLGECSHEAAALIIARLTQTPLRDLMVSGPQMDADALARAMVILLGAHGRHRDVTDPIEVLAADTIAAREDVLFFFTGLASVSGIETLRFAPGALADHLTSFGGQLTDSSQMSALHWLEAGATASYGTVTEPCNHRQKFPLPAVAMFFYAGGATAIEAYWKSVAWPGEGVFIGEPLSRPFGWQASERSPGVWELRLHAPRPGRVHLEHARSPMGPFRPVSASRPIVRGMNRLTLTTAANSGFLRPAFTVH